MDSKIRAEAAHAPVALSVVPGRFQDLRRTAVPDGYRGRSKAFVQTWWIVQALLVGTSPQFMYGWRRAIWRLFGAKVGTGVLIRPSARVTYPWKVVVGDRSQIGDRAELYSLGPIAIGDDAVISQDVYLCTGSHDHRDPAFPLIIDRVVVEREAWVAAGSFVGPGVVIGRGTVVGARSLVLDSLPAGKIAAGHPARVLQDRDMHGTATAPQ